MLKGNYIYNGEKNNNENLIANFPFLIGIWGCLDLLCDCVFNKKNLNKLIFNVKWITVRTFRPKKHWVDD